MDEAQGEARMVARNAQQPATNTGITRDLHELYQQRSLANEAAHLLPYLRSGLAVVDCGCGSGSITLDLAEAVKPGRVVGFDADTAAIEQARQRAMERGCDNVEFAVGDVYEPGLTDGTFDVVHYCGVLAHLADPAKALAVAARLLK